VKIERNDGLKKADAVLSELRANKTKMALYVRAYRNGRENGVEITPMLTGSAYELGGALNLSFFVSESRGSDALVVRKCTHTHGFDQSPNVCEKCYARQPHTTESANEFGYRGYDAAKAAAYIVRTIRALPKSKKRKAA